MSLESTIRGVLTEQVAPKQITEAKDPNEYDQEGDMMKSQLRQINSAIDKLMGMVKDDDNLPEWVQSKMTKATDYIRSVRDYLESEKMDDDEEEMDEAYSPMHVKQAIGIASDKRYKGGNMTGAVAAIEKLKKGLSNHPQVKAVLKRVNEEWVCGKCNCDPCTCEENLQEGINQKKFAAGAKAMKAYAMKHGGVDKADFMKVADSLAKISRINLLQAGQELSRLNRLVDNQDTDVRERIYVELKKVGLVESLEEAKKVSSMQIHKVLAPTKNSREGIAALKKAFRVNDMEAKKMLNQVMNEETPGEMRAADKSVNEMGPRHTSKPMNKRFGGAVDAKRFDTYKKFVKQNNVDEPTVRMILDNPNSAESKRMMKNKNIAKAVDLRKAAMKESVNIEEAATNEAKKSEETVNIRQSLKKAIDMRGQKEVVFKDGSKAKISVQDAEKAMKMLDNTRMAKAKQDLTIRMMKSHQDFKDALAGKKPKVDPFALRVKTNEATIPDGQTVFTKRPEITSDDKDKLGSVAKMMNREKAKRHMDLAKKARADGDYDKANKHTQMARSLQNEGSFASKFKADLKEKKRAMKETKGAPKGYHFTKDGKLKKGDAGQDGHGGKMLRSDPLDKQRSKIPPLPENDK